MLDDLALLRIEIETIWPTDVRGRVVGRELVLASSRIGLAVALSLAVPDGVAAQLEGLVAAAAPATDLREPPAVLEQCRRLLEPAIGPLVLAAGSGPSYLITGDTRFAASVPIV